MHANLAGPYREGVTIFVFFNAAAMMQVHELNRGGGVGNVPSERVNYPTYRMNRMTPTLVPSRMRSGILVVAYARATVGAV